MEFAIRKKALSATVRAMRKNIKSYDCFWGYASRKRQFVNLNYLLAYAECGVAFWNNVGKYSNSYNCLRLLKRQSLNTVFYGLHRDVCFAFAGTKEGFAYWDQRVEKMTSILKRIDYDGLGEYRFLDMITLDVVLI